jgi:hypothetical protein
MFAYQEEQAWVASVEKTQNVEYSVIQLNATLYSFIDDTDFEYVNEDVVINNKNYHIFKKRIQNNILSLYYLRNSHQDAVGKDLNEIVDNQLFNTSSSKESPVKKLLKSFLKDYIPSDAVCVAFSPEKVSEAVALIRTPNKALHAAYLTLFSPPPEIA